MKQATARRKVGEESKEATQMTKQANAALLGQLPFGVTQAFDDIKKGFMAPLPDGGVIKNDKGQTIYDLSQFSFIKEGDPAPDAVNPSLWRQAQLIMKGGLFEVTRGIYQVRAADLSNITIIEGEEGIVVVDPLIPPKPPRLLWIFTTRIGRRRNPWSRSSTPTATSITLAVFAESCPRRM